jgi:hypothetical protein
MSIDDLTSQLEEEIEDAEEGEWVEEAQGCMTYARSLWYSRGVNRLTVMLEWTLGHY